MDISSRRSDIARSFVHVTFGDRQDDGLRESRCFRRMWRTRTSLGSADAGADDDDDDDDAGASPPPPSLSLR
jgi:hypothetical protein